MSKIILLLVGCLVVGLYENWWLIDDFLYPTPTSSTAEKGKVVLYATQWCGYCAKTRKFFAQQNIAYRELDVESSEQGRLEYKRMGGGGVPIIVVNGSTVIRGFDPDAINEALGRSP